MAATARSGLARTFAVLLVVATAASNSVLGETRQQKFKIRRILKSTWTAAETSNPGEYNNVAMCSQFCLLKGEACSAFHHNNGDDKCEIGHLSDDALLDAEGIEIYAKPENATIYPHIMVNEWNGNFININLKDMTMEHPTFLDLPAGGLGEPSWGRWYKNGFFFCYHSSPYPCKHYSITTGTWADKGNLPESHHQEPGTVAILDELWFVSGLYSNKKVSYLKDWTWHAAPDYPFTLWHAATATISWTEFMVCGGYDASNTYNQCYKMDAAKKDAWVQLASMPVARRQFNMAMYTDDATGKAKVMAVGGFGTSGDLSQIDTYDVDSNSWVMAGNFPFVVYSSGLFTHNNVVWHIGGHTVGNAPSRKVHRYNAGTGTWTDTGNDLPADVHNAQLIRFNEIGQ